MSTLTREQIINKVIIWLKEERHTPGGGIINLTSPNYREWFGEDLCQWFESNPRYMKDRYPDARLTWYTVKHDRIRNLHLTVWPIKEE